MYVDALWVQQEGVSRPDQLEPLLDAIARRTGLSIALDGIYRWVAFLPSRVDERVPVGNRYFGVFQDGSIKVRGLEARRRDTPPWVAETQMALIQHLALAPDASRLPEYLPGAVDIVRGALAGLRQGRVPPEALVAAQRLTRVPEKYASPSPAAWAALQLREIGQQVQPGQRVRFVYTLGRPGARAWDLPQPLNPASLDLPRYKKLLIRAASAVLQPLGVDEAQLTARLLGGVARRLEFL
jgi:DNA polymerase-2